MRSCRSGSKIVHLVVVEMWSQPPKASWFALSWGTGTIELNLRSEL